MSVIDFILKNAVSIVGGIAAILAAIGAVSAAVKARSGKCKGCHKSQLIALQMNEVDQCLEVVKQKMLAKYSTLLKERMPGDLTQSKEFKRYEAHLFHLGYVLQERFRAFMRLNGLGEKDEREFKFYRIERLEVIKSVIVSFFNRWYNEDAPDGVSVFKANAELWPEIETMLEALFDKCREFAKEGQ